tara:strand:- start:1371 stop:1772 length:402 start_codon:yes stop_codon:yes gene_type:complete
MKLLFDNANKSYDGFEEYVPVLVGSSWVGLANVDKQIGEKLVKLAGVQKLSDEDWDFYKKKAGEEAVTFRKFNSVRQEADRNPLAEHAVPIKQEGSESPLPKSKSKSAKPKKSIKEMIKTEAVDADTEDVSDG